MLKVGDKVKIKEGLNHYTWCDGVLVGAIANLAGQIVTIQKYEFHLGMNIYSVYENDYCYTLGMFDLATGGLIKTDKPINETNWKELYKKHIDEENKRFGITDRYYNPEG